MSASPPATANKRAASPLSPDTAQTSSKRAKEDPESKDKSDGVKLEASTEKKSVSGLPAAPNGKGNGAAGETQANDASKMDEDRNEG